jgi:hypothetical protein
MNSVCRAGVAYILLVYTEFFSFQARTDWTRLYFIPSFPCQYELLFAKFVIFLSALLFFFFSLVMQCLCLKTSHFPSQKTTFVLYPMESSVFLSLQVGGCLYENTSTSPYSERRNMYHIFSLKKQTNKRAGPPLRSKK